MNANKLDPRGPQGKRTSGSLRRFLARVGLLPPIPVSSVEPQAPKKPCLRIPVWDSKLGAYRDVNPQDRHDPLRESARMISEAQSSISRSNPPRTPFGGGSCVALCEDED